jgi:hypothetical protein
MKYGIDYGNKKSNIDQRTGIRYGVIPCDLVDHLWDYMEAVYSAECPHCGTEIEDVVCGHCDMENDVEELEPVCHKYEGNGYILITGGDCIDLWVIKSPLYTYSKFCSPCAPGACYLPDFIEGSTPDDNKCYCLGSEWFNGAPGYEVHRL